MLIRHVSVLRHQRAVRNTAADVVLLAMHHHFDKLHMQRQILVHIFRASVDEISGEKLPSLRAVNDFIRLDRRTVHLQGRAPFIELIVVRLGHVRLVLEKMRRPEQLVGMVDSIFCLHETFV